MCMEIWAYLFLLYFLVGSLMLTFMSFGFPLNFVDISLLTYRSHLIMSP